MTQNQQPKVNNPATHRWHLAILVVFSALLFSGCVTSNVEQLRHKPSAQLLNGETVVVLGRRQSFRHQTEADFTGCVYKNLLNRQGLPVKPEEQFMDEMFPWFQPRTAPLTSDALAYRLRDPALAQRLKEIGTRYVIWLDGVTTRTGDGGSMSCTIGPTGGGCFGMMWWENDAVYSANIWDMKDFRSLGKITVDANGTSYMPAVVIPIPIIAPTQSAACSGVAKQIEEFLQPSTSGPSSTAAGSSIQNGSGGDSNNASQLNSNSAIEEI
jgi:hypothetical protein